MLIHAKREWIVKSIPLTTTVIITLTQDMLHSLYLQHPYQPFPAVPDDI